MRAVATRETARSKRSQRLIALAATVGLLATIVACGSDDSSSSAAETSAATAASAATETSAATEAPETTAAAAATAVPDTSESSSDRPTLEAGMATLYDAAIANGETEILFTVSTGQTVRHSEMVKLFNETYPDITVSFKETDFLSMGAVMQTELDSGQPAGDLASNAFLGLKPLVDAGNILYTDWAQHGVAEDRIEHTAEGGFGVIASESLCNQVVWNRKYVSDDEIPEVIEDFATDPVWDGKMVTEPNNAYACFGFRALRFGVDHEIQFAKDLKDNGLLFSAGYSQLFASGERPVAQVSSSTQIATWQAAGIDVGEKVYSGSGVIQSRVAVVKGTKVPNAAKLYAVWLTSPEASRKWEELAPGTGFLNDPESSLYQHVVTDLGLDVSDHEFFLYETSENFSIRAETAAGVAEAVS